MNIWSKITLIAALPVALAACTPRDMETTPVQVKTPKGTVTCQLYGSMTTMWDRSIDRPNKMSVTEADQACVAEGQRRMNMRATPAATATTEAAATEAAKTAAY